VKALMRRCMAIVLILVSVVIRRADRTRRQTPRCRTAVRVYGRPCARVKEGER
jgi:hypothetical protein